MEKIILIIDPFSTGALIAPKLEKKGITCYAVTSTPEIPDRFMNSYTGNGFIENKLYSVDEIVKKVDPSCVIAVIPGAETGVYCAEELSYLYKTDSNNYKTTDFRRNKSSMQERLVEKGLLSIKSKKISKKNNCINYLNSDSGYVVKPNNSCLTDNVFFFENKKDLIKWIGKIDWDKKNIIGLKNDFFLVQEKLIGDEFVVDLISRKGELKVCTLCKYTKGLHNDSHFVYEKLEVIDLNNKDYAEIINYAKLASIALGVDFGLAHIEIINTKNGPILIELGARLHGGIAPMVFEDCYLPDLLNSYIELLLGNFNTTIPILKKCARIVFLINTDKDFKVNNIIKLKEKINSINGVKHIKLFFNEKKIIPLTTDLSNCPGIISILAENNNELDEIEKIIRSYFKEGNIHV